MTDTLTRTPPAHPTAPPPSSQRPGISRRLPTPGPHGRVPALGPLVARLGKSLSVRGWLALTAAVLLGLFAGLLGYLTPTTPGRELSLDRLDSLAEREEIARATFLDQDARVGGVTRGGDRFWVAYPASDAATAALLKDLTTSGAQVTVDAQEPKAVARVVATGLLPLMILAAVFGLILAGGREGAGDQIKSFGTLGRRDGGRAAPPDARFSDVAGADEAVAELREVVEYLDDPARYAALGASPPRGVLLFGPPGTGKTLIARATAGEAGVPFFSVAGAEFVESLVGVGAARIRDLFESVRAVAPAIVFIDEIDAAGRRRGGADGGSSEEREQTLNQLLVELDGFATSSGIVVMAATNRPDILDPALLRPGRFDRHVTVDHPDRPGRRRILAVHTEDKPLAPDVDLDHVARRTPGFTGADLANVVNEAALLAIREKQATIGMRQLLEAIDRVLGGPRRRGRVLSEPVRRRIAVHEAGHAVVATALGEEVHRVSVVARGSALGGASLASDRDAVLLTAQELFDDVVLALSGRCAEELVLGTASTGSEADLERATRRAADMVCRYGMGEQIGRIRLAGPATDVFLHGETSLTTMSEELRRRYEADTGRVLARAFEQGTELLRRHRDLLETLVDRLLVDEALEGPTLDGYLAALRP